MKRALVDLTKTYCRAVKSEWRVLSADGKDLPLHQVFVMLQAVERPARTLDDDPQELASGEERLAYARITIQPERRKQKEQKAPPPPVELSQALKEAQHLVLLGEPGSGKSTTLQFIGFSFVHGDWAKERLLSDEARVPVKLDLRAHAETLAQTGPTMEKALSDEVRNYLRNLSPDESSTLIQDWLAEDSLLVLLDGLDEVPDRLRKAVGDEINRFARLHPECQLVLSSRLAGYRSVGGGFKEYALKPLESTDEAQVYLQSWLSALRNDWDANAEAERLLDEMTRRPALRRITDNPLILRIAAQVYASKRQIARNRAGLYELYLGALWDRAVDRGAKGEEKDHAWKSIEDLAWSLQNNQPIELSTENEILVRKRMGLVVRVGESWVFSHTTLQEYFVAQRLKRAWMENRPGAWAFLRPRLHAPAWREPLFLLAGSLESHQAEDLIQRVRKAGSPYERRLHRDLFLAASLVAENEDISGRVRQELAEFLIKALKEKDPNVRRAAAEALGELGDPRAVLPLLQVLQGKDVLKALQDDDKGVRRAAKNALVSGIRDIHALLQMLQDEDKQIRYETVILLGQIRDPQAIPDLLQKLKDEDDVVRREAERVIDEIGDTQAIPVFLQALEDESEDVRRVAAKALEKIGDPQTVPSFLQALEDESEDVRRISAKALGKIGDTRAVLTLLRAREEDKSEGVRDVAWAALKKIGDTRAIPALIQALKDENQGVRRNAVWLLREIGDAKAVQALIQLLPGDTRYVAADALGKIGDAQAVIQAIHVEDLRARHAAVEALKKISSTEAVPILLRALKDEDQQIRCAAAKALGKIGDARTAPELLQAIKNEDREKCKTALIEALGRIGDSQAVPVLLQTLKDENRPICYTAVKALGEIGDARSVPDLLRIFKSEEVWDPVYPIRDAAAEALGKIGDVRAVPALAQELREKDSKVHMTVADALLEIGDARAILTLVEILHTDNRFSWLEERVIEKALPKLDLGNMIVEEAIQVLIRVIKEGDWPIRGAAARALARMKDERVVRALIQVLEDKKCFNRFVAADALGYIGDVQAVPALLRALNDEGEVVRRSAVRALGKIEDTRAIPALLTRALEDESHDVRRSAVWVLGKIGDVQIVSGLLQVLRDNNDDVQEEAKRVLLKIMNTQAVPDLLSAFKDEDSWRVREVAAWALGEIGDIQAVPDLLQTLTFCDENLRVRWHAAWALGEIRDARSVPALNRTLKHESWWLQRTAAKALGKIGDVRATPDLLSVIQGRFTVLIGEIKGIFHTIADEELRSYVLWMVDFWKEISWVDIPKLVPLLYQMLQDIGVRSAAAEALGKILSSLPEPEDENERRQYLRWLHAALRAKRFNENKYPLAERLAELELTGSPYQDPFQPPPPSRWRVILRGTGIGLLIAAGLGLLAVLMLLSGLLQDALKDVLGTSVSTWVQARPWTALGAVALLAALGGLLAWGVERLKQIWKKDSAD